MLYSPSFFYLLEQNFVFSKQWRKQESNLQCSDYEPDELPITLFRVAFFINQYRKQLTTFCLINSQLPRFCFTTNNGTTAQRHNGTTAQRGLLEQHLVLLLLLEQKNTWFFFERFFRNEPFWFFFSSGFLEQRRRVCFKRRTACFKNHSNGSFLKNRSENTCSSFFERHKHLFFLLFLETKPW